MDVVKEDMRLVSVREEDAGTESDGGRRLKEEDLSKVFLISVV